MHGAGRATSGLIAWRNVSCNPLLAKVKRELIRKLLFFPITNLYEVTAFCALRARRRLLMI